MSQSSGTQPMPKDYTAEAQATHEAEIRSFQPAQPEPPVDGHDLKPRGMSEKEIAQAEYEKNFGYPRDTSNIDTSNIDKGQLEHDEPEFER
jgi:hypothetical protein